MSELGNIKQVAGDAGHELADLGVVVVGVRELLQMGEQVFSHIRLDPGTHHVAHIGHIVVGGSVDDPKHQIKRSYLQNHPNSEAQNIVGGLVGDKPYDEGQSQLTQSGEKGKDEVQRQYPSIFFEIRCKSAN